MRRFGLLLVAAIFAHPWAARAQGTPAQAWRELDPGTHRRLYVMGIIDGISLAQIQAGRLFADSAVKRAWLKQPPNAKYPIDSALAVLVHGYKTANVDAVVETMTKLYDEPANSCLSWYAVTMLAVERLNGMTASQQEDETAKLRRVSAEICKPR